MPAIEEVRKHNTPASCWVIVHGLVYDVSEFLPKHPGGSASILRYAGKDATAEFDAIHPPNTMEDELPKDKHLGPAQGAMNDTAVQPKQEGQGVESLMPIDSCVNLNDLELAAKRNLSEHAWIYYSSAAQDRATYDRNIQDWKHISFRPRFMRDVSSVNMQQPILGFCSNLPLFIAPCALGKLGHPDGELCLVRGAAHANTPYCPSNSTSVSHQALAECLSSEGTGGCLFFQLYVKTSRAETIANIEMARKLGYKALIITIDTNVVGVREDDDRRKIRQALENGQKYVSPWQAALANKAAGAVPRAYHSPTLNWKDLEWIRRAWQNAGPICLKGILTPEDAKIACDMGVDGIYLSNHGGRQLDHAPSALSVLMEIRLYYPQVLRKTEIFVDGGVRRGTDVLKALCLGATAVGLGRPFMYALSAYGTDGVHKAFEMLQDEIATGMRLLGATSVSELNSHMVNPRELEFLITSAPPPIGQRSHL